MSDSGRVKQVQQAAEEVKVLMVENLQKTEQRSEKFTELDKRAEQLKARSKTFERTSMKVKKKKASWFQSLKDKKKLIAVVTGMFIIIIVVVIIMQISKSNTHLAAQEKGIATMTTTMGPGK